MNSIFTTITHNVSLDDFFCMRFLKMGERDMWLAVEDTPHGVASTAMTTQQIKDRFDIVLPSRMTDTNLSRLIADNPNDKDLGAAVRSFDNEMKVKNENAKFYRYE